MNEIITISVFMGLGKLALAMAVVVGGLWLLDKWNKQPFTEAQTAMAPDPLAVSHYRGLRFAGVCILAGLLLGT